MKEFCVGLLVILLIGALTLLGFLLFPLLLLMGLFLRFFVGLIFMLLVVWLIGKVTLVSIEHLRKKE